VEIDDPVNLLEGSYDRPYYEAWKVVDGVVIHEDEGPEYYDDSFSNCGDGFFMNTVAENNAKKIRTVGVQKTYVSYNCRVFWVESGTVAYRTVEQWKPADQIGIKMAGKLRASYDATIELDEGKERKFQRNSVLLKIDLFKKLSLKHDVYDLPGIKEPGDNATRVGKPRAYNHGSKYCGVDAVRILWPAPLARRIQSMTK
jgi:hypothetical protein